DPPVAACPVRLPQLAAQDLAGGVPREAIDDVDVLGALVARELGAAEVDQLLLACASARPETDGSAHRFSPELVGNAEDGHFGHRGMPRERLLDLPGIDIDAS